MLRVNRGMVGGPQCPSCGDSHTDVYDSRRAPGTILRRRKCQKCAHRFPTWETMEDPQQAGHLVRMMEGLGHKIDALAKASQVVVVKEERKVVNWK